MADDAAVILDHPTLTERTFFPRRAPIAAPFVVPVAGAQLHCYRTAAAVEEAPWLLHFHGNGEVVADWVRELPAALEPAGIGVLLSEYRGYGGSTGAPALATMLEDALAVADAAAPAHRTIVYGRSIGSIFALHVAANRPVAGLILESAIADVHQRLALRVDAEELGTTDAGLLAAAEALVCHRTKIAAHRGPVLILHARHDHLVPVDHAEQLAVWAGARGTLRLYERGDHNTIHADNGPAISEEILQFVGRYARARMPTCPRCRRSYWRAIDRAVTNPPPSPAAACAVDGVCAGGRTHAHVECACGVDLLVTTAHGARGCATYDAQCPVCGALHDAGCSC